MFKDLIKISDHQYKIYKRNKSTMVVGIPNEYSNYRGLHKGQYLYAFFANYQDKKLLCFSEIELQGTIRVKVVENSSWLRLTVPKLIYNTLKHSDNNYYTAYHNSKGILIFEQEEKLIH